MTDLVACLSTGKGTWSHVSQLLRSGEWEHVYLLTNQFGIDNFQKNDKTELITIDEQKSLKELRDDIKTALQEKIKSSEIAVNFVSGDGREHMALVTALIQLGVSIRFVIPTEKGVEEI